MIWTHLQLLIGHIERPLEILALCFKFPTIQNWDVFTVLGSEMTTDSGGIATLGIEVLSV